MLRGDRLKKLRLERRYTHEELAELIQVNSKQIWRYEASKTDPAGDIVSKIADVFGVSTDYLLGRTDDPEIHFRVDNLSAKERELIRVFRQSGVVAAIRVLVTED